MEFALWLSKKDYEEIDFFSFERKRYQSFCKSKLLLLTFIDVLYFIGDVCLGDQAKKELLELISN